MKNCKYILFDCMETIVDLTRLPNLRDYAAWGYDGSGVEELWSSFDEYFQYYILAKADLTAQLADNREYEMLERFMQVIKLSLPDLDYDRAEAASRKLYDNYWRNYKAMSYIRDDIQEVLPQLAQKYKLGMVSNFMVAGGIEELLDLHGVIHFFDFVVTSIAEGWRKPHPAIYEIAVGKFGARTDEIIFVGDDYVNDYITPAELGIKPFFLDRYGRHPEISDRVTSFYELRDKLI